MSERYKYKVTGLDREGRPIGKPKKIGSSQYVWLHGVKIVASALAGEILFVQEGIRLENDHLFPKIHLEGLQYLSFTVGQKVRMYPTQPLNGKGRRAGLEIVRMK